MDKKDTLQIQEYLSAAALRAAGALLLEVRPDPRGGRCQIVFDDADGKASELLTAHRSGALEVRSRDMADATEAIKSEIFAARRGA